MHITIYNVGEQQGLNVSHSELYSVSCDNLWKRESVSCSVVSDSLRAPWRQPARLLCPQNSPGKNTGVGSHSLLQGIFLTQGLSLDLLSCRQILYCLSHHIHRHYINTSCLILLFWNYTTVLGVSKSQTQLSNWVCMHAFLNFSVNKKSWKCK